MSAGAIDDELMPSQTDDFMPSQADEQMPSHTDEVMPSQQLQGLPLITIPSKWKLKPDLGVHQPSQSSSGFFGSPSAQNVDDWSFTAATAPKIFNNAVTRGIGSGLNFAGQALKGDAESMLFSAAGDNQDANQQLIATAEKMMPSTVAQDRALGIGGTDPYEDARATLPGWQQMASGIGPGLIQSAPQLAVTAIQPELGAASFGFTPQGFDPVQAAAAMAAPIGGKFLGGVAEDLAAKAGISDAQALDTINRVGGGAGVASIISAPTAYQIAQMKPGPDRNAAVQDAASNAILTAFLGSIGARDTLPEVERPNAPNTETAGANVIPKESSSTIPPTQNPVSEQDNQAAALKNLQDMLRGSLPAQGQQTPADKADEIIRNVFPAEKQSVADAALKQQPNSGVLQTAVSGTELARDAGTAKDAEALPSSIAKIGQSPNNNYRATFFAANPGLKGQAVVHHAVEQQALTRYPLTFTKSEIHSIENLRGIPKEINPDLYLSQIRREWTRFYKANPNATREQILQHAAKIDSKYGSQFIPPVN